MTDWDSWFAKKRADSVTPTVTTAETVTAAVTDEWVIAEPVVIEDAVVSQGRALQHCPGCRCPKYETPAAKQKAYRERKRAG